MEQGDLRGALQLYHDQIQLEHQLRSEDPSNTEPSPLPGYNMALSRQLQGDLPGPFDRTIMIQENRHRVIACNHRLGAQADARDCNDRDRSR